MALPRYIWVKNKRLYKYSTYSSWEEAIRTAKYFQKRLRNNYFILKTERFNTAEPFYGLYMNKVYSLI